MHRSLYGTGGQILPVYKSLWAFVSSSFHLAPAYPPEKWAEGFVLRPALITYSVGYGLLLLVLRSFRWGREIRLRTILIITVAVGLPFLLMPHLMSSDLFDYTSFARLWVVHGTSPYMSSISEYPEDPFFPVTCWKAATSVYGPAYTLLSIGFVHVAALFGDSLLPSVLVHRTAMFAFQLWSGALIWTILSRANAPDRAFKTALFLLNPLIMIEFPGNGHNEAMMIAFLLAAIALGQRDRWALAAVAFAFAVQTKLYCLPVFCFYVAYRCWSARSAPGAAKRLISLAAVFAITSLILYLPFGLTPATILSPISGPGGSSMTKSLGDYLAYKAPFRLNELPIIGLLFGGYGPADVRRVSLLATFFVCLLGVFHARTLSRSVAAMAFFALFWCVIGATWFMPWYVTTAVALACISPSRPVALSSMTLSFTVFVIYLLEGWGFSRDGKIHNLAVAYFELMVFLPPVFVLAVASAWQRYVDRRRIVTLQRKLGPAV